MTTDTILTEMQELGILITTIAESLDPHRGISIRKEETLEWEKELPKTKAVTTYKAVIYMQPGANLVGKGETVFKAVRQLEVAIALKEHQGLIR